MAAEKVKSCCSGVFGLFSSVLLEYDTAKIVHIKNWKVGILNRLVQLVIVGYIVVYGIVLDKGYQRFGPVAGIVTTKLKGASLYNGTYGDFSQNCNNSMLDYTYDVADYVIPPQEPNSFFVMTNLWRTCGQKQGICAEAIGVTNTSCDPQAASHPNCTENVVREAGNGPLTGRCLHVPGSAPNIGQCEMRGWCPVEAENKNITHRGPKINASDFTVFVKNSIEYPTIKKGYRKRNILPEAEKEFLEKCQYNSTQKNTTYCPIFSLAAVVDMIPPDKHGQKTNFTKLSIEGGVVGLEVLWDCDHLERGLEHCDPVYSAKRLDDANVSLSPGYNFRFAKYYLDSDGEQMRTLYKAYGILFKVEVTGTGGSFDFVTFALKLGSMIALLGIATIVSDVIVLYVLRKGGYYRKKKYLNVNEPINVDQTYDIIDEEDRSFADSAAGPPVYGSTHFEDKVKK